MFDFFEKKEEEEEVDSRVAMLDTEGFADFLAKYPEEIDLENVPEEDLAVRFEAFERAREVQENLFALYKDEILRETGMELPDDANEAIAEYLESAAIEDPERVAMLGDLHTRYKQLSVEIGQSEGDLASKLNEDILETVDGTKGFGNLKNSAVIGWFFRSKEESEARKAYFKDYGLKMGDIEDAKEFATIRRTLIKDLEPAKFIAEETRKEVVEQMGKLAQSEDATEEDWQKYYDIVERMSADNGDTSLDYFGEREGETSEEGIREILKNRIEMATMDKISKEIGAFTTKDKKSPVSAMQRVLEVFVKKEKVVGETGDEAKGKVVEMFREILRNEKDKAKKLIIQAWFISNKLPMTAPIAA